MKSNILIQNKLTSTNSLFFFNSKIFLDAYDKYLISSIILESLSTFTLKKTLNNKYWFFVVYLGYGISFYIFPKALEKYSLSYAYTIWCGLGLIITTILDLIFYKTKITTKKIIGTLSIISGIKLIK
tara:strand:+ start:1258 stop:1638 length:381 start_codon:yes stop_codon:yes gene_type:complete